MQYHFPLSFTNSCKTEPKKKLLDYCCFKSVSNFSFIKVLSCSEFWLSFVNGISRSFIFKFKLAYFVKLCQFSFFPFFCSFLFFIYRIRVISFWLYFTAIALILRESETLILKILHHDIKKYRSNIGFHDNH